LRVRPTIARHEIPPTKTDGEAEAFLTQEFSDLDYTQCRLERDAPVSAVPVSHHRSFLNRTCTHMLAFKGDAHVEWFEGNSEDYEADKIDRLGPDAVEPKRISTKSLCDNSD
jgi:hypothetical protein